MRKAIRALLGITCLIFALHGSVYAQAPASIGTITFIEGISDIVRNNQEPLFVSEHQPVYVNDRIRTKSYSKVEITFADKSVLKLAPGSCVTIQEYRLSDNKIRELAHISLTRGKIETIVAKTGAPETFIVDTPNAKGAVKGSDIFFSFIGGRTAVFVQEGAISVMNPSSPDLKTRLTKGNCVFVPFNETPGEVRSARDTEMNYFKRSVEPEFVKKWIPTKGANLMNAVIVSLSGDVRFNKKGSGDWVEAQSNGVLSEGDKLQTGDNGTAEIRLSNGNAILLQRNAELGFADLRYDQASGNYQNTFEMTRGKLSAVVENINKQCTFQVKTPTSVCGVRGTFLEVAMVPAAAGAATQPAATQAFFEGGNGYVTSAATGQTQEVGSGQNVNVDAAGTISAPAYTTDEQRTGMFQVWTAARTVGSYSTVQGATGVGGGSTTEPPAPPSPEPLKGSGFSPLDENLKNPATPPDLPFVEVLPPVDPMIYQAQLHLESAIPSDGIIAAYVDVVEKQSGDLRWTVNGNYGSGAQDNMSFTLGNANNDSMTINGTGDGGMLSETSGTWTCTGSGTIDGSPVVVSGGGTYSGGETGGTFTGVGTGHRTAP